MLSDRQQNPSINPLSWESDFFSLMMGKVDIAQIDHLTVEACQQWALVQANVESDDYATLDKLSALGFQLVEGEADYALPVTETERQEGIRIARPSQIEQLKVLAARAFTESRFREPWVTDNSRQQFYARWIENAVLGQFDDQCLIAVDDTGAINGMVSLRQHDQHARIGLLAVESEQRGLGIGQRLVLAAADWARVRGLKQLWVATQLSNVAAMRLYARAGARLMSTRYWLYRKNDDSI